MSAEDIANRARNAISDYCVNECKAYAAEKDFLFSQKKKWN